jgi:hypothetical protein
MDDERCCGIRREEPTYNSSSLDDLWMLSDGRDLFLAIVTAESLFRLRLIFPSFAVIGAGVETDSGDTSVSSFWESSARNPLVYDWMAVRRLNLEEISCEPQSRPAPRRTNPMCYWD